MVLDKSNYLSVLEDFPTQCREGMGLPKGIAVSGEVGTVVVTGMGGSAIVGDILKTYMAESKIPVFVNRSGKLPNFVDEYTLVFGLSYSGNTEETISAISEAQDKGAKTACITSGGKLADICDKVVKIPSGFQPRAALGYLFFPMLGVLYNSGIANVSNSDLNEMIVNLKDTEKFKEDAQKVVKKLDNRIPIIYSSDVLAPVAYRWKTQFNENAKCPAFYHTFPEASHNEVEGYAGMDRKKFVAIMIRDEADDESTKKRMDACKEIFEGRVDVIEVFTKGKSLLSKMFSTIYLGDFVSYYQAVRNHVDPGPVHAIERVKDMVRE